jgi:hypothetical protein
MKTTEKALAISFVASLSTAIISEALNTVLTSYLLVAVLLAITSIGLNFLLKASAPLSILTPCATLLISLGFATLPKATHSLSVLAIAGQTVVSMSPTWVDFFAILLLSMGLLTFTLSFAIYENHIRRKK